VCNISYFRDIEQQLYFASLNESGWYISLVTQGAMIKRDEYGE